MASRPNMGTAVDAADTRTVPESTSGAIQPREDSGDRLIERHIAEWDQLRRKAVSLWGGQASLAALLGKSESDICDRLNRKMVKGALMRPFGDYEAIASTHPAAAESFLYGLCDLLGFEHPKRKRTKTVPEKFEALVKSLRRCGPLGEAALDRAAKELGVDPSEFES